MAYGRASAIPGSNVTLLVLGVGEDKGAGENWDGPRGAKVGLTGIGGDQGAEGLTVDQSRRCPIRKWGAFRRTVGRRRGVWVCQNGSRGGRVDGIVGLGIQIYINIRYGSFG